MNCPHFLFFWNLVKMLDLSQQCPTSLQLSKNVIQPNQWRGMLAVPAGHSPCCDASFVLDRGHVTRPLTAHCDSSASDEVTCGSRLRENHQLLSARSVTSCQLGRVSCQCQPGGDSKWWPGGKRAELLKNSPYLHCKDREWGDFARQPWSPDLPQRSRCI